MGRMRRPGKTMLIGRETHCEKVKPNLMKVCGLWTDLQSGLAIDPVSLSTRRNVLVDLGLSI